MTMPETAILCDDCFYVALGGADMGRDGPWASGAGGAAVRGGDGGGGGRRSPSLPRVQLW